MTDVVFPVLARDKPHVEGVVSTWFVDDGQSVTAGQLLAEVMVEKASVEVSAPAAGVVRLLVAEETAVIQGAVIARIE
ncbi:MAG: biotin/lipoyl-binding protein [Actinomycetales bacterium]|nr:biotin/lipoyl-binding protein [Actinomycetales bacterium]